MAAWRSRRQRSLSLIYTTLPGAANAHAQRPEGEHGEPPVRCSVKLGSATSLNNLVRTLQYRLWDREAKRLGGLKVDHELELCTLLHGKVCRLRTPEDLVNVDASAPVGIFVAWVVAHQTAGLHEGPPLEHC